MMADRWVGSSVETTAELMAPRRAEKLVEQMAESWDG